MKTSSPVYSKAFQAARDDAPVGRATPADAFNAARDTFMTCRRIEMRDLAETLDVSRTTIYNWCGDRDQLLVDVLWSIAADILDAAWHEHQSLEGTPRLHAVSEAVIRTFAGAPSLQVLLQNETHAALRLLTGRGGVHDRFVARIVELVAEETARGTLRLETRPELLAEGMVCVIESGLYNDRIAAVDPEIERTLDIIGLLLRGAERPVAT